MKRALLAAAVLGIATATAAAAPGASVTRLALPLPSPADPCAGEVVELTGDLQLEAVVHEGRDGVPVLRAMLQATDVHGTTAGGAAYRLVGESRRVERLRHRDRIVTEADFAVLAHASPGVSVGRATVRREAKVTVVVLLSKEATVADAVVAGVVLDRRCPPHDGRP